MSDTHEVMTALILLSVILKFSWQSHLYISVCVCVMWASFNIVM